MSSSSLQTSSSPIFVADSSVVINLNATNRAREIVKSFHSSFVVVDEALAELRSGTIRGHNDAEKLLALIAEGFIALVHSVGDGVSIYESLVSGPAIHTLDDGEAATIGFAFECGGAALIDERKAQNICAARFPDMRVISTVDLLLDDRTAFALGRQGQIDAIFNALRNARMRVPTVHIKKVVALIGKERAAMCSSIPRSHI